MTQSQFMYDLMIELDGVPDEDKFILMNDYTRYFSDRLGDGMSEERIIEELSSPREIAQRYKNGTPIPIEGVDSVLTSDGKGNKTALSVIKFILLVPVCAVYEVLAAAVGAVMIAAAVVLCVAGAFVSVAAFMSASLNFGFVLLGAGGIFMTFAFVMLCSAAFKAAVGLVRFFPRFMGGVLRNQKRGRKH